jgi:hypothetical protein
VTRDELKKALEMAIHASWKSPDTQPESEDELGAELVLALLQAMPKAQLLCSVYGDPVVEPGQKRIFASGSIKGGDMILHCPEAVRIADQTVIAAVDAEHALRAALASVHRNAISN